MNAPTPPVPYINDLGLPALDAKSPWIFRMTPREMQGIQEQVK